MVRIANVAYGPGLCDWLRERCPDIVTLQKTGSKLPAEDLRKMGYENTVLASAHRHLGVAVLSRRDPWRKQDVQARDLPGAEGESRFLTVDVGGLRVSSVYAPYGREKPGQTAIERRIAWLNRLRNHVDNQGYVRRDSLLCGDFNVKFRADEPDEPRKGLYPKSVEDALQELLELGFVDLYRRAHPNPRAQPGRTHRYKDTHPSGTSRLHLVLASVSLAQRLRSACVDVHSRPWPRKDAPPLVVELDGATGSTPDECNALGPVVRPPAGG